MFIMVPHRNPPNGDDDKICTYCADHSKACASIQRRKRVGVRPISTCQESLRPDFGVPGILVELPGKLEEVMDCYPLPSLTKRPCMLDMVLAELLAQCGILTDEQIVWAVARAGKVGHTLGGVLKEALCLSALQLFSLRRLAVRYLNDADALDWYLSRIRSLLGYGLTRCNLEPSRDSARLAA